jgi:Tfp pilus assembly protein PilO
MASNRIWIIGGVLVIVLVAALALLLGIKPQLDAVSTANTDRASVESQNLLAQAELESLKVEFATLGELKSDLAVVQKSIPATTNYAELNTQLATLQASTGVTITNFTAQDAVPFVPSEEVVTDVPATITATNFTVLPIQVSITGESTALFRFVQGLQTGERLFMVKSLVLSEPTKLEITGMAYVLTDAVPAAAPTDGTVATEDPGTTVN